MRQNVALALPKSADKDAAVSKALELVGLTDFADKKATSLSGGETQRMAIARILALPRPLILLDEPTSATDISASLAIENSLKNYCESANCTLLFATHSLAQARRLADTALMLHEGRIVEFGSAGEVFEKPKSDEARIFFDFWQHLG